MSQLLQGTVELGYPGIEAGVLADAEIERGRGKLQRHLDHLPGQSQLVEFEAGHQWVGHHQIPPPRRQHFEDIIDIDGVMNGEVRQVLLAPAVTEIVEKGKRFEIAQAAGSLKLHHAGMGTLGKNG